MAWWKPFSCFLWHSWSLQAALLDSLPDTVVTILQDAIESGNKGLLNWLFSHQSVRVLSLMSIPCLLPADMAYATVIKVFENAPKLPYTLKTLSAAVIQLLAQTITKHFSPTYSAHLSCQLAFTEYNEGELSRIFNGVVSTQKRRVWWCQWK